MRKRIIPVFALAGAGLALFFFWHSGGSSVDTVSTEGPLAAPVGRASAAAEPENPEDLGVRGDADAGSTPMLARAPSEDEGVLEVEVLAGERPVPGANVRLYWRGPRDPNLNQISWRLASMGSTDGQGYVRLASRPGNYLVAVRSPGHGALLREVLRPYGEARTFLSLSLEPGQVLTGHTEEEGSHEPLPLVELSLTAHGGKLELWQTPEAPAEERVYSSSDERGNFRVEGLAPGEYLLEARAPGHARAVIRSVKVPAEKPLTVTLQAASVIEGFVVDARGAPAAGAEVQVGGRVPEVTATGSGGGFSVEVEPGEHIVSARRGAESGALDKAVIVSAGKTLRDVRIRLGQSATLEGHVVARSTGAPIEGASVSLSPYGTSGDSGRGVTDGAGLFSVGGLAPGSYDLVVSAPGFVTISRRALTVASGERFSLELQLTGTGAVEGQVVDGAGQPLPGVRIMGSSRWGGGGLDAPVESRTDAQGHYRLEGVPSGSANISARREGSAMGRSQLVEVSEGETIQADFTLEDLGTVEGVVRTSEGPPPAESLMALAIPRGGLGFSSGENSIMEVAPEGTFRMSLPPGSYEIRVVLSDFGASSGYTSRRVSIEPGKTVQVELVWRHDPHQRDELRGRVLEPDGSPSPGALVLVTSGEDAMSQRATASTDGQGRFSLSLPAWVSRLSEPLRLVARNGGRIGELAGVKPGEQDLTLNLRPAASVRGRVVRAGGGAPVKGFTLTLQSQQLELFPFGNGTWEFPGDHFELRDVPAEPLRVVVRTVDGSGGETQVTPSPGGSEEVELSLKGTASVKGRVVDAATQEPVAGAVVLIQGDRPLDLDKATGPDGRFSLEGVGPGERLLVIVGDGAVERRPVTLAEGQVVDLGDIPLGDY